MLTVAIKFRQRHAVFMAVISITHLVSERVRLIPAVVLFMLCALVMAKYLQMATLGKTDADDSAPPPISF